MSTSSLDIVGRRMREEVERTTHYVISPSGVKIAIPKELYVALERILVTDKPTGNLDITFRNGGIATVQLHTTERLK